MRVTTKNRLKSNTRTHNSYGNCFSADKYLSQEAQPCASAACYTSHAQWRHTAPLQNRTPVWSVTVPSTHQPQSCLFYDDLPVTMLYSVDERAKSEQLWRIYGIRPHGLSLQAIKTARSLGPATSQPPLYEPTYKVHNTNTMQRKSAKRGKREKLYKYIFY
jgi:hypothetical protein